MRFVIAIVAFVLAAAAIGLGVAQRTILLGPESISSSVATADTPLTVIDAAALNAHAGRQTIDVAAEGEIMLAYGRTADVMAWVGDASYNEIGWDAEAGELTTRLVSGTEDASIVPSPVGSDLWLREFTSVDTLTRLLNAPEGISVIIAVGPGGTPLPEGQEAPVAPTETEETEAGAEASPSVAADLTITWPLDTTTPFAGPLVIGGIVLLLGGLGAFLWALVTARRTHGPRRSQPKLPKRPKPPQLKKPKKARGESSPTPELEAASGGPRTSGRRRAFTALGGVALAALVLTGCTTGSDQPGPEASVTPGVATAPVAVTKSQFSGILLDVVTTVADADEARDAELAAERLTGPALALRVANYAIRGADSAYGPLPAIPDETIEITLPEQRATWPRTVFAVTSAEGVSPVGLVLTQASPRENYKLTYLVTLIATVPDVAPVEIGAALLPPDNRLGLLAPAELADAYGELLIEDAEAESFELFQAEGDSLREQIGKAKKDERAAALGSSATLAFSTQPAEVDPAAFLTNDSGQIVAVALDDIETATPVEAGAAINPSGQVKALSGRTQTTRGIQATYGVQLLFYVPPAAATDQQIVLLGYAQGLVSAIELG